MRPIRLKNNVLLGSMMVMIFSLSFLMLGVFLTLSIIIYSFMEGDYFALLGLLFSIILMVVGIKGVERWIQYKIKTGHRLNQVKS